MERLAVRNGLDSIDYYMVGISRLAGFDRVAKLSSNESPLGMSAKARAAARAAVAAAHLYPETDTETLKDAIADRFSLDPVRIAFGAGSDDLLVRLVSTFAGPGDEVVHSAHAYMQFPIYAKRAGAAPVAAPDDDFRHSVDGILGCVTGRTRVVIVANPDNPSGTYLPGREIRRLRQALPANVLLIVDAAYDEFASAPDYETAAPLVEACENVVMTRTFSKVFGLAGLRIGWCYAPADIVSVLERTGPSFPLNTVAEAAARAAIADRAFADRVLAHNTRWRSWFTKRLRALGLQVYDSQTNFVLVRFPPECGRTAADTDAMLQSHGIIARRFAVADFEDKLRFTIGRAWEMKAAAAALRAFLAV